MLKRYPILIEILIIISLFSMSNIYPQEQDAPQSTTIKGRIIHIFRSYAVLEAEDNKEYEVFLGPPWFLMESDIFIKRGDNIEATGELEEYMDMRTIYPHVISLGDEKIHFVDEEGIPFWAYRGFRGRAPIRYENYQARYSYRGWNRYGPYWGRNRIYGRRMFWRNRWGQRGGCPWINRRGWGSGYWDRGQERGYYYRRRSNPRSYWDYYKEKER